MLKIYLVARSSKKENEVLISYFYVHYASYREF